MANTADTSVIQRLIGQTRRRIRTQWALEGATIATIGAAALALVAVVSMRRDWLATNIGTAMLVLAGVIVLGGAVIKSTRALNAERVARRIDRASNLADRLSTAIAFEDVLSGKRPPVSDEQTEAMMQLAIKDGVRAAARADIHAAAPFVMPEALPVAAGCIGVVMLAWLAIPAVIWAAPHVTGVTPDHATAGQVVTITGSALTRGLRSTHEVQEAGGSRTTPLVPADGNVALGTLAKSQPVKIIDWTKTAITVELPRDAKLGDQQLLVYIATTRIGMTNLTIVSSKDQSFHKEGAVELSPDEQAYIKALLAELHDAAIRDTVPELEDFTKAIEKALAQAENGEISKEQLLDDLAKAEDALAKNNEPKQDEIDKQLDAVANELGKEAITKDIADALKKKELQKAKEELEKLAEKLATKQLDDKQKEDLQKKLDQVAKLMAKQDKQDQDKGQKQQDKVKDEIRRLEKQKQEAKNEQQRQESERRLEDKQRELQKLQKDQEEKNQSDQRRAVKRLQKDMEKAAENLQKPQKDPDQKDDQDAKEQQEQHEKQASENLKDAARETGKVDQDQRKQATQKKMSSQMDDLREAMRRAKQKSNKGPNDPFNKNGKNQDFISRARGGKGQGQGQGQGGAWKPGQDQDQGQDPGGDSWGTGHDDNLTAGETHKSGNDKDQDLQGQQGDKGGSTRETILSAAQKGFAGVGYKKVYADYQKAEEAVMRNEKIPSSYKYYVKRYFANIHPNMAAQDAPK
jgi:hypothetical protein